MSSTTVSISLRMTHSIAERAAHDCDVSFREARRNAPIGTILSIRETGH
jgi:hypothetical protein